MTLKNLTTKYDQYTTDQNFSVYRVQLENDTVETALLARNNNGDVIDGVYDKNVVMDLSPRIKEGDRIDVLRVVGNDNCAVSQTGKYYTVIGRNGTNKSIAAHYAYAVAHKPNEYVRAVLINNLGGFNLTDDNKVLFNSLVHITRIGIVVLDAVAAAETIDFSAANDLGDIDNVNNSLNFAANDVAGKFTELYCNYISDKIGVEPNANVANNKGRAIVYFVYDSDIDVKITIPQHGANATATGYSIAKVYADLASVYHSYTSITYITGDAKLKAQKGNTALTTAAVLANKQEVIAENKYIAGDMLVLSQSVADTTNTPIIIEGVFKFKPHV